MIRFYKDNLVPQELCRMLYAVVPKACHVPVRFHNRRQKDLHGEWGLYPLGSVDRPRHSVIDINLNPIYEVSWNKGDGFSALAPSSALWRLLLEVCLHEFGHVATKKEAYKMNHHEYHRKYGYGRVYKVTERLADEWMERSMARILKVDPRLGQPRYMSGYLGARLIKWREWAKDCPGSYPYIMERRCQRTGGQLTAGDVLRKLNIYPYHYTNAYTLLKRASEGIGIDYLDRAGRYHKLYTWGDVSLIAERFERERLRKNKSVESQEQLGEESQEQLDEEWDFDDWEL